MADDWPLPTYTKPSKTYGSFKMLLYGYEEDKLTPNLLANSIRISVRQTLTDLLQSAIFEAMEIEKKKNEAQALQKAPQDKIEQWITNSNQIAATTYCRRYKAARAEIYRITNSVFSNNIIRKIDRIIDHRGIKCHEITTNNISPDLFFCFNDKESKNLIGIIDERITQLKAYSEIWPKFLAKITKQTQQILSKRRRRESLWKEIQNRKVPMPLRHQKDREKA